MLGRGFRKQLSENYIFDCQMIMCVEKNILLPNMLFFTFSLQFRNFFSYLCTQKSETCAALRATLTISFVRGAMHVVTQKSETCATLLYTLLLKKRSRDER